MPQFDYRCDACDRTETRWFANLAEREQYDQTVHPCKPCPKPGKVCAGKMHRQPSAPSFRVNGYNAENGYGQPTSNKGVV